MLFSQWRIPSYILGAARGSQHGPAAALSQDHDAARDTDCRSEGPAAPDCRGGGEAQGERCSADCGSTDRNERAGDATVGARQPVGGASVSSGTPRDSGPSSFTVNAAISSTTAMQP